MLASIGVGRLNETAAIGQFAILFGDRIIHLIRNSLAFVSWKDRKLVMPDLKAIYRAETAEAAAAKLDAFEAEWGKRYPAIGQAWRRAWQRLSIPVGTKFEPHALAAFRCASESASSGFRIPSPRWSNARKASISRYPVVAGCPGSIPFAL